VLWGPSPNTLEWIPDAFTQRFPGVKVTWAADEQSPTKIIAEDRAGRRAADVLFFSLGGILPLHERKLLDKMDWATWGVDPGNVMLDGTVGATHNLVYTVMYNSSLVRPDQAPKTWDDLASPAWHGKVAASDFTLPRLLAFLVLAWDEPRVLEYTRALRDRSGIMLTRTPIEAVLESGERSVGVGQFVNNVLRFKDEGRPLDWVPMSPTGAAQFVIAPLTKAPHPNAARLLAGWLASDEGKATAEELRYNPDVRPGSRSRVAQQLREANVQVIIEDPSNVERRAELYTKFSPIVSGQAP
jgi:ABC-type Fe3+ transport system substrate-binding protein